ncbi:MAG: glycosyltransferase [Bacteroidetes bacterium]|nr:glycosyltransferase [Bacteroidota bacterium]
MNDHSFVVLAYRNSPYLDECINSLMHQTSKSEICICTSTPSDYISAIAKKYGIEVFVTDYGKGVVHDNNFAFQQVKTKYVTIAHQDDLYLPEYADTCIAAAKKYSDTLICFTNYVEIMDGQDRPITLMLKVKRLILSIFMPFKSHLSATFWKKRILSFGNPIALPTIMYNLENLLTFPDRIVASSKHHRLANMVQFLRTKRVGFIMLRKVLLKRRIHSESLSSAGLENNFKI